MIKSDLKSLLPSKLLNGVTRCEGKLGNIGEIKVIFVFCWRIWIKKDEFNDN